jgi:hypothetical protein
MRWLLLFQFYELELFSFPLDEQQLAQATSFSLVERSGFLPKRVLDR